MWSPSYYFQKQTMLNKMKMFKKDFFLIPILCFSLANVKCFLEKLAKSLFRKIKASNACYNTNLKETRKICETNDEWGKKLAQNKNLANNFEIVVSRAKRQEKFFLVSLKVALRQQVFQLLREKDEISREISF